MTAIGAFDKCERARVKSGIERGANACEKARMDRGDRLADGTGIIRKQSS